MSKCPVLEIGRNSVMPSTIPKMRVFNKSCMMELDGLLLMRHSPLPPPAAEHRDRSEHDDRIIAGARVRSEPDARLNLAREHAGFELRQRFAHVSLRRNQCSNAIV